LLYFEIIYRFDVSNKTRQMKKRNKQVLRYVKFLVKIICLQKIRDVHIFFNLFYILDLALSEYEPVNELEYQ
jgi:hypothetical protein